MKKGCHIIFVIRDNVNTTTSYLLSKWPIRGKEFTQSNGYIKSNLMQK